MITDAVYIALPALASLILCIWILRVKKAKNPIVLSGVAIVIITAYSILNGHITFQTEIDAHHEYTLFVLNVDQFDNDKDKVSKILELIDSFNPDFILLQEFGLYYKWPDTKSVAIDFANRANMKYIHFEPHEGNIFGTAVFSKHKILGSTLIFNQISQTNEAWLHKVKVDESTIDLINVHLQSFNLDQVGYVSALNDFSKTTELQLVQANLISESKSSQHQTIVCGDMNTSAGSQPYNVLKRNFRYSQVNRAWLDAYLHAITNSN